MKILEVTNLFAPVHGGAADAPFQLCRQLSQRGHEITVYTTDYKLTDEYTSQLPGVKIKAFHTWFELANLHFTPGIIPAAKKEVKRFDVIHAHNYRTFQNMIVCHYANQYHVPYVLQSHGGVMPVLQRKGLKVMYDRVAGYKILRNAGKVIAGNVTEIGEYKNMGVDESKVVVIPPFYNTDEYAELPSPGLFRLKYGIKEKFIVLFLGRIHKIKGIDFLVDAFAELNKQRGDVFLAIVGPDGGFKAAVEEQVNKLNLAGKVLFTGLLTGVDKYSAYVDASMLVQTSIYERGPGSPFEAILCGTPIIITRNTGAGEIVAKMDAGYLVDYGNIPELTNLMKKIIDNPSEIMRKTERARESIINNLSWQNGVGQFEKVYESLLSKGKEN